MTVIWGGSYHRPVFSLAAAHPAPRRPVLRTLAALRSFLRRAEKSSAGGPVLAASPPAVPYPVWRDALRRVNHQIVTQSHGPIPSRSRAAQRAA